MRNKLTKILGLALMLCLVFSVSASASDDITWTEVETEAQLDAALQTVKSLPAYGVGTSYGSDAIEGNPYIKLTADITTTISLTVREETIFDMNGCKIIMAENASIINLMDSDLVVYFEDNAVTVASGEVYTAKSTPSEITEVDTFWELVNALQADKPYIKLTDDIVCTSTGTLSSGFSGVLDGNGFTLTMHSSGNTIVSSPDNGLVIKDLNIIIPGTISFLVAYPATGDNVVIDNVDVLDNGIGYVEMSDNCSAYITFNYGGNVIMANCDNYQNYSGTGHYSIFIGAIGGKTTYSNCVNYGNAYGYSVALFSGNPYYLVSKSVGTTEIYVSECYNEGEIIGTFRAEVFGKGNGGSYDTWPIRFNEQFPAETINRNGGVILDASTYSPGFTINVAEDGIITMTDTNEPSAVIYSLELKSYAYNGSTSFFSGPVIQNVTLEEFNAEEMRYGHLIDTETFAEYFPDAKTYLPPWTNTAAGAEPYEIAVIDGTLYYVLDLTADGFTHDDVLPGRPRAYAYDETGKLIGSQDTLIKAANITIPDLVAAVDGVAYFTMEDALAAVAENGGTLVLLVPIDVNSDGETNMLDVQVILKIATGAETDETLIAKADVNGDGVVNSLDAYALYSVI